MEILKKNNFRIFSRVFILLLLSVSVFSLTSQNTEAATPTDVPQFYRWFGPGASSGDMSNTVNGFVGKDGYIYVIKGNSVLKIKENGIIMDTFGGSGSGDGQFNNPTALVLDNSGNIYVLDEGNARIEKLDSHGNFVKSWDETSNGDTGSFSSLDDIEIGPNNILYVLSSGGNNKVYEYDTNGNFITKWGESGSDDGQFFYPVGLGIDSNNNYVYIADSSKNIVEKFDLNGNYISKIGTDNSGDSDGEFSTDKDVVVDSLGNIYVVDSGNYRIQKFDSNGNFVSKWGQSSQGQPLGGYFSSPKSIFKDNTNNIYVIDSNNGIQKFDSNGNFVSRFGGLTNPTIEGGMQYGGYIAVAQDGSVYEGDISKSLIQKYDANGNFVLSWDGASTTEGSFNRISGVNLDSEGNVYVVGYGNGYINKYDPDGNFLEQIGNGHPSEGANGDGYFYSVKSMVIDHDDNIYVADQGPRNIIQKFDSEGNFVKDWDVDDFNGNIFMSGLAVDKDNNIYVLDYAGNGIQKFDSEGNSLKEWNFNTLSTGDFFNPSGIMVDNDNYVYVSDSGNNRIVKSDTDGNYLSEWGSVGGELNHFSNPMGLTADKDNDIYVLDSGNYRVQVFSYSLPASNENDNNDDSDNNDNNNSTPITTSSAASISCDPTLYTPNGYLAPKPGGLSACGNSQVNTGPAIITFSDGTTYIINNNNTTTTTTVNNPNNSSNQTNSTVYQFTRDLELGMKGDDVKALQIYLNTHGYIVSTTGAGSIGNETNYFGSLTKQALSKFQKDHNIYPTAGYFGPITRKFILSQ